MRIGCDTIYRCGRWLRIVLVFSLLKAIHLIAAVSWFAGLFYLPRLFIYHQTLLNLKPGDEKLVLDDANTKTHETFVRMQSKLLRIIMLPAMIVTWGAGLGMIVNVPGVLVSASWLWIKIALLIVLTGFHLYARYYHAQLADGRAMLGDGRLRLLNEIPTVVLVIVIPLAVFQP